MKKNFKIAARVTVLLVFAGLGGCATPYVDLTLKDLKPEDRVQVLKPKPVQLVFEFQTKGVANGQGTDQLKPVVLSAVKESGAFSEVDDTPPPNGALLHISLNNVPLSDDAFAKGFVTGFTFGLVGNTVGDGYICTVDYVPGPNAPKITKVLRDAIYTSLGATAPTPEHAMKMKGFKEAADFMTRKVVANGINELAKDPDFAK